jgi:hypothetical protein
MVQSYNEMNNLVKKCNKDNVLIVPKGQGFDVCYILPGLGKFDMNTELELEDGVTYNKGQLKRAFSIHIKLTKSRQDITDLKTLTFRNNQNIILVTLFN